MSDPTIVSGAAVRGAYGAARDVRPAPAARTDGPESFSDMVRAAASGAASTARAAESAAEGALRGEVGTQQVVEATMELETTLRVAVSVRDKVVQAYQDILRMQI
ncbi:flagellar hook-basal body complex protein FliE [Jannaschia sp. Os4]|uniref:flagellar hook-basal body complex protein FliE n=1 Tax=Jannaschia sp. Os4 TaxID=2807617 RepID=UPI0019392D1D|nr:flagellar hook-basal body complex protein FliE [Jannaschia sp. Os4]MBM2575658.1 flagellar hook-basal body complex protein FliE [Jannaschia sp. Os4]